MAIQKVIRGEEGTEVSRWELPEVAAGQQKKPLTVREIEEIEKRAYDEGFKRGREDGFSKGKQEGFAAGQKEVQDQAARLRRVLDSLALPLEELDELVEQQLSQLALVLAQQIIRRELQTQPGEVIAVVREAVGLLPFGAREVKVHLHPEDARLLREATGAGEDTPAWKIIEDPAISRGGCRVLTATSHIDATLERRLGALAADLLGGARDADGAGETQ